MLNHRRKRQKLTGMVVTKFICSSNKKNKTLPWPNMNFTCSRYKTGDFLTKDTHSVELVRVSFYCTYLKSELFCFLVFFRFTAVCHLNDGSHVHVAECVKKSDYMHFSTHHFLTAVYKTVKLNALHKAANNNNVI